MPSNRERALDAAVELLGTAGVRALTHARVDERAGLPRGSASNSFRTRAALLRGVVEHMVARELPAVTAGFAPDTPEELVDAIVALFEFLTGPSRTMTTARLALLIEASSDADLRSALAQGRTTMEQTIVPAFAALRSPDPRLAAQAVAVCFEGLFLHSIAGHAEIDARAVLSLVIRSGIAPRRP